MVQRAPIKSFLEDKIIYFTFFGPQPHTRQNLNMNKSYQGIEHLLLFCCMQVASEIDMLTTKDMHIHEINYYIWKVSFSVEFMYVWCLVENFINKLGIPHFIHVLSTFHPQLSFTQSLHMYCTWKIFIPQ